MYIFEGGPNRGRGRREVKIKVEGGQNRGGGRREVKIKVGGRSE